MKTILLGTIVLLPCLLVFNDSDYVFVNVLGLAYIGFLFYAAHKSKRFKQILIDFDTMVQYYNDKILK